jgi:hypothetical protein
LNSSVGHLKQEAEASTREPRRSFRSRNQAFSHFLSWGFALLQQVPVQRVRAATKQTKFDMNLNPAVKTVVLASCLFAAGANSHAQGFIVPNGVTYNGFDGLGYSVFVTQSATTGDYTGFDLKPVGNTPPSSTYINTYLFNPIVDEEVRTFLVSPNDPVSLQPIQANNYPELTYPNKYVFSDGVHFFLGFYTGYNPWDSHGNYTGIYTDPVFGWGEFVNNRGAIEFIGGALEAGGGGIYAGTRNIISIPEPISLRLIALGLFISLVAIRRWQAQKI